MDIAIESSLLHCSINDLLFPYGLLLGKSAKLNKIFDFLGIVGLIAEGG